MERLVPNMALDGPFGNSLPFMQGLQLFVDEALL